MIETMFQEIAGIIALGIEAIVVIIVATSALRAAVSAIPLLFSADGMLKEGRAIWLRFASSILLALEFALASDIIRTAVAPTWDDIGKLGAIAAIRTALNLFLARDIESMAKEGQKADRPES